MATGQRPRIDADTIVARAEGLSERPLEDGLAVLEPASGQLFKLDAIAADAWRLLATPGNVAALCDALQQQYDVDGETCRRQVLTLVRQWAVAGLVTAPNATGRPARRRPSRWRRLARRLTRR